MNRTETRDINCQVRKIQYNEQGNNSTVVTTRIILQITAFYKHVIPYEINNVFSKINWN